jgi:hypothetical protein
MSTENVAQGHTIVEEEEEVIMKNLQSGGSGSFSGSYESPKDEFTHLLLKRRASSMLSNPWVLSIMGIMCASILGHGVSTKSIVKMYVIIVLCIYIFFTIFHCLLNSFLLHQHTGGMGLPFYS